MNSLTVAGATIRDLMSGYRVRPAAQSVSFGCYLDAVSVICKRYLDCLRQASNTQRAA